MKKRWIPVLVAGVLLLSAVVFLLILRGKDNDTPAPYEPLEIKSDFFVSYEEIEGAYKIDAGEWPILRFDSYQQVLDFEEEYNTKEVSPDGGVNPISDIYDETFFETKTLILVCGDNTTDETVQLGEVSYDGEKFSIEICFHKENPKLAYAQWMEYWGYAIVMDKQTMTSDTEFKTQKTTVPYSFWSRVKSVLS